MNAVITEISAKATSQYPYTHRVEFKDASQKEYDNIRIWLEENKIPCVHMPIFELETHLRGFAIYVGKKDALMLGLKWV